mmetsp:Transcript_55709/g.92194  ORF Transcript_55709/g.92194 Transcript_55709/m.92194 type:complete len:189 (+) Transcript_55709:30-596(+)
MAGVRTSNTSLEAAERAAEAARAVEAASVAAVECGVATAADEEAEVEAAEAAEMDETDLLRKMSNTSANAPADDTSKGVEGERNGTAVMPLAAIRAQDSWVLDASVDDRSPRMAFFLYNQTLSRIEKQLKKAKLPMTCEKGREELSRVEKRLAEVKMRVWRAKGESEAAQMRTKTTEAAELPTQTMQA